MSQCLGFSSTWFSLRFPGRLTLLLSTQWITSTTEGRKFGKGLTLAVILGISSELFSLERNSDILPFFGITHHMTPSHPHPSPSVHPHTPTPPQLSTSHSPFLPICPPSHPTPPFLSTLTPLPLPICLTYLYRSTVLSTHSVRQMVFNRMVITGCVLGIVFRLEKRKIFYLSVAKGKAEQRKQQK